MCVVLGFDRIGIGVGLWVCVLWVVRWFCPMLCVAGGGGGCLGGVVWMVGVDYRCRCHSPCHYHHHHHHRRRHHRRRHRRESNHQHFQRPRPYQDKIRANHYDPCSAAPASEAARTMLKVKTVQVPQRGTDPGMFSEWRNCEAWHRSRLFFGTAYPRPAFPFPLHFPDDWDWKECIAEGEHLWVAVVVRCDD